MINKNFCLRMSVMILIFGFAAVWSVEAQTDSRLNGKWDGTVQGIEIELSLNNGNYESTSNGVSDSRGTYTTLNDRFTMKPTHIHGESFNKSAGAPYLESKWYTVNEFIVVFRAIFLELGVSEEITNQLINLIISPPSTTYSVDANTLILTVSIEGQNFVQIYTKR